MLTEHVVFLYIAVEGASEDVCNLNDIHTAYNVVWLDSCMVDVALNNYGLAQIAMQKEKGPWWWYQCSFVALYT